jgi:hypoxanthine-guanine phosphoribosyltransferase
MTTYILPPHQGLIHDPALFPLLAGAERQAHLEHTTRYPLTITLADGHRLPLLTGGVATRQELASIAQGCATALLSRTGGKKVLLVELLEGAKFFFDQVLACLEAEQGAAGSVFTHASIKISSYQDGSRASSHRVSRPLVDRQGRQITDLTTFDTICVLDDLIDAGATFAWLVTEYLPTLGPARVHGYFMLDEERPRAPRISELLARCHLVIGKLVPDQWLVGYGPDITLAGGPDASPLHLFRGELPGGVYAFNSAIERQLTAAYQQQPQWVTAQLAPYISAL